MERNYSNFADLCMMTSGGQPWALDMRARSGNSVLLAYLVNSTCQLLVEANAISDGFQKSDKGLTVVPGDTRDAALAPPALVLLALRYAKSKLVDNGTWRHDAVEAVMKACPEVAFAEPGQVIFPDAAGHWAINLLNGDWLRSPAAQRDLAPEAGYAPAR